MEEKVAGTYFEEGADRIEGIITISVDNDGVDEKPEVTISTKSGDIMVCLSKEDFDRIAEKIKNYQKE